MNKINFTDGTKISSAKVTIDEVDYPVTPARYSGATPLSAVVMNTMQDNIEDAIDQNISNIGGEEYDETQVYYTGDITKHEGQLYIANQDILTPEEWDSTKWNATDVLSSAGGNEVVIGTNADITGKTKLFVEESTQTLKYKNSTTGQFENLTSEDIVIGEPEDVTPETKIFIDESEGTDAYSEVVNSLAGDEIAKAPSVHAVNEALEPLNVGLTLLSDIFNVPTKSLSDVNTLDIGVFNVPSSAQNIPLAVAGKLISLKPSGDNYRFQIMIFNYTPDIYTRYRYYNNGQFLWSAWKTL